MFLVNSDRHNCGSTNLSLLILPSFLTRDAYATQIAQYMLWPGVYRSVSSRCSIETAERIEIVFGTVVALGLSYIVL